MPGLLQRLSAALADRYRIERELGRGGMATVFLAEDLRHRRRVALKVLDPELAQAIGPERFRREIETVARLTHPHILALFDSGEADGLLYFVMPYIAGESLRRRLERDQQLPLEDALRITREVADALGCAHAHGVVHRDVKPENILLEEGHAVVADFGIARAVAAAGTTALTTTGITVGTPAYMSPEQAAGSHAVDGRSDQYSLGCVLYEMLAGVPPFAGVTAESLVRQHLSVSPRPVTELRPAVPATVAAALQRALAKAPADRYATTGEFAAALGQREAAVASLAASTAAAPPRQRRARWLVAAVAVLAVALWAFAAWQRWWPFGGGASPPTKKEWILVAEFEGPDDEPDVARAVQGLTAAALDQSGIVMTVPRDQIRVALENAGRPDTQLVNGPLARELAYRNGIRAVLEGRVSRVGAGYGIVLRLSESGNDSTMVAVNGSARNSDALIRAADRLARRMRRALGESPAALRTTRELWVIKTPSFEAYRKIDQGDDYWNETGDAVEGMRFQRDALESDPDCATAYSEMSVIYFAAGRPDSAVWACDQALRRPWRLTDEQRLATEARRAFYRADFDGMRRALDRQLRLHPTGIYAGTAYNVRAVTNAWSGRPAAAVEDGRRNIEASPLGATQMTLSLQCGYEIAAGQLDQAEKTLGRLRPPWWMPAAVRLAAARDDWAKAESLCANPPASAAPDPSLEATVRCVQHAKRGELRSARDAIAREVAQRWPDGALLGPGTALMLAIVSGTPVPGPDAVLAGDARTRSTVSRAWRDAAAGDLTAARRELEALRRKDPDELARSGAARQFIEACIAAAEERWNDVIRLIGPTALRGDDWAASSWGRIGPMPERWLVAEAYNRIGPPDSAAVAYERVLNTTWRINLAFFPPYAHQRLVMIYARMGRREDAERHWQAFSAAFTNPDPEVRHLLDEARAAILSLRAMSPRKG